MAFAREIMQGGFSAGGADAIQGGVNLTLSAAGTTQGTATAINTSNVLVSTVASGAGVIIPALQQGDWGIIYNGGANPLLVYPPTGAKINQAATNAGITLATNTNLLFFCFSSTQFMAHLSA